MEKKKGEKNIKEYNDKQAMSHIEKLLQDVCKFKKNNFSFSFEK